MFLRHVGEDVRFSGVAMIDSGYPVWVLYLALALIVGIIFKRSFFGNIILFAVMMTDQVYYTFTRFPAFGPFLNLLDILLIGMLIPAIRLKERATMIWPPCLTLILVVLFIGMTVAAMTFPISYESLRTFKLALYFPLGLFIGANWLRGSRNLKLFIIMFIVAVFAQSARHILYFDRYDIENEIDATRTLRFFLSGLVVVFLIVRYHEYTPFYGWNLFYFLAIAVSVAALILQQTRSIWTSQALFILIAVLGWIKRGSLRHGWKAFRMTFYMGLPILGMLIVIGKATSWHIDLLDLFVNGRSMDFTDSNGRWNAIKVETIEWLNGNVILGNGLGYYTAPKYVTYQYVAWGHNGYIAYLSNVGLIGFVVFAILVPVSYFRSIKALVGATNPDIRLMAGFGQFFLFMVIIISALSGGLLGSQFTAIYGFFLGYCHLLRNTRE